MLLVHDPMVGVLGALSWVTCFALWSLATEGWMMYLATGLSSIGDIITCQLSHTLLHCDFQTSCSCNLDGNFSYLEFQKFKTATALKVKLISVVPAFTFTFTFT